MPHFLILDFEGHSSIFTSSKQVMHIGILIPKLCNSNYKGQVCLTLCYIPPNKEVSNEGSGKFLSFITFEVVVAGVVVVVAVVVVGAPIYFTKDNNYFFISFN